MKKTQKKFNDLVYNSLKESRTFSLNMLFEENSDEKKSDADQDDDLFSMDDESSDDSNNDSNNDDSTQDNVDGLGVDNNAEDANDIAFHAANSMIGDLSDIIKAREVGEISGVTRESYARNSSIKKFLVVEKDDPEEFVSDLKKAVDKNEDLINKIKKQKAELESGTDISVDEEVRIAIDKLIHFKEKVDIIELVEELFINKIKLIAPVEKIESTVDEFIELYRDEVHKNRAKIDIPGSKHYNDEEVYLDKGNDYNGAVGAKSQG